MARPLRVTFPNAVYHVTSRGNGQGPIYLKPEDREEFLKILGAVVDRFGWICYAYCLMDNHYHFLVETPSPNLSLGMRQLNGVYTQWFNRVHRHVGHLFQGRFKGIVVQKGAHLLELARYIVLNPVRAKMVKRPEDYHWSSYSSTMGTVDSPKLLQAGVLLRNFGSTTPSARRAYAQFVMDGTEDRPWDKLKGEIFFGEEGFVESLSPASESCEIPKVQRVPIRIPLKELLAGANGVLAAYRTHGYRLREIADALGVHYTTVSRRLVALENKVR